VSTAAPALLITIHDVLERLRAASTDERDKGDRFERLMQAYLRTVDPWATRFDEVWRWSEWPDRAGRPDTGIDLVARERDGGGLCAIQCKCFAPTHPLVKGDIDSFFTASGKAGFTSRLIVSTADRWSQHAEDALHGQQIPTNRLGIGELDQHGIDWSAFDVDDPSSLPPVDRKSLRDHQREAIAHVLAGLVEHDRGKLIMACGTGKTFTALKLAEQLAPSGGRVLFLVPSISLLAQSLTEWTAAAEQRLHPIAVCSDPRASRGATRREDASVHDLAFPATTDPTRVVEQARAIEARSPEGLTVVFSTYQSIEAVHDAQHAGLGDFDLIVCDEAHRTTGATVAGDDESAFVRVHDGDFIRANKRLYMTATPRIYGDASRAKAAEGSVTLASMDDESVFGPELYRLGFGAAVESGLLADYKVLVLAVDEQAVEPIWQRVMTDDDGAELRLDDVARIVGCWNGLAKRGVDRERLGIGASLEPMRRAVAFAHDIKTSKHVAELLDLVSREIESDEAAGEALGLRTRHVDGTMNVLERTSALDWLKADASGQGNVCRILTNARCLSEGVDVPALDAVLFLNPRNSEVDVVQSVGRVMRKSPGKDYGYIILPIGIPAGMAPEEALKENKRYKVVWQVLQALRAHDDRFDAIVNKIDLNRQRDETLQVIGVGRGEGGDLEADGGTGAAEQQAWSFTELEEWRDAIYAKIVQKVGTRTYWEQWSTDVAELAERHDARITELVRGADAGLQSQFEQFVAALRHQINDSISESAAIQMLAQHLVTRPVFEALFEHYDFAAHNPIAQAMQRMLDALEGRGFDEHQGSDQLQKFYDSVRARAAGIDNAEGKQAIIKELYEKFFKLVFPKVAESLGIVYTPIEVVDWIIDAVQTVLREQFGASIADSGVHVIDPFTGTGTFLVRLMQSGLFTPEQLAKKFGDGSPGSSEIHANEILLLAYYVAAVNIESTFHAIVSQDGLRTADYLPFSGILLTDTFLRGRGEDVESMGADMFPENNERAKQQDQLDITVVIGNPPYSAGQSSQNDANANLKYEALDRRIEQTYAKRSTATNKNSLYDSYIRAIRWASDRIEDRGVVAFVTNGAYIDSNTADGLRQCLVEEFDELWIYNLRGAARGSGEARRKEAGNVFGSGSRTPVAVMVLVRNPDRTIPGTIHYRDIGDYLSREDKLDAVRRDGLAAVDWSSVTMNEHGDWVNLRDPRFESWMPIESMFTVFSGGLKTNRDAWVYGSSAATVRANVERMVDFYNAQVDSFTSVDALDLDPMKFSWNRADRTNVARGRRYSIRSEAARIGQYRPFQKQHVWFDRELNDMVYRLQSLHPSQGITNRSICLTSAGSHYEFAPIEVDSLPNLHVLDTAQAFPRHTWQRVDDMSLEASSGSEDVVDGYRRIDNINPGVLAEYREHLGDDLTGNDLFDYVYGLLHSPEYRTRFAADLNKMLPRIPRVATRAAFEAFRDAGHRLGELHVEYEAQPPFELDEQVQEGAPSDPFDRFRVTKMKFAKVRDADGKLVADRSTVIYNEHVTLSGIPEDAYRYVLGPRSAIDWIIDRYQVKTDKASGIVNDPNDWSREVNDPRYIVDLLKRVVTVSVETNRIVDALPSLDLT
jgi:predicted helicase